MMIKARSQKSLLTILGVLGALVVLAVVGCSREAPEEPATQTPPSTAEAPPPPALDPRTLQPVIREVGAQGTGPSKIVIELARPVIDASQVDQAVGERTVLEITPPVDGQLSFTSPSTLTFSSEDGFAPATRYEVELKALETPRGVLEAPTDGRWVRIFETPDFDFVRFSLAQIDYPKRQARVDMVFSAGVDPREVKDRATLLVEAPGAGKRSPAVDFVAGSEPQTVVAVLDSQDIRPGAKIVLELKKGVPSRVDPQRESRRASAVLQLAMGPETKIMNAYRAEGTNGFYVQVICDDASVDTRRYFWAREIRRSYRLSSRCVLDEADAQAGIRFDPPVDFSLAPASGGFRVFGDFARGTYQMSLMAGLRTADGGMVHRAYQTEINIPARSPRVNFVTQGRYLPRSAWSSLPIRHLNLDESVLQVRHVPAENLVFWMSDDHSENADERTSNLILEQTLKFTGEADVETTTYIDIESMIPANTKGLLEVQLAGGGANDTARILLTDIHLLAKRAGPAPGEPEDREVLAWALDVETNAPLGGVDIQLVRKSGFVVSRCRTAGDGGCRLRTSAESVDPGQPFALLARRHDDLTYLKFAELEAEVQEARVAGEPYRGSRKYRAAIYSDRGVYRPGETTHVAAILRQENHLAPPVALPVQAELADPRGKVMKSFTLKTNAAGYVDLDLPFPAFAATGRYELKMNVGDQTVGQYRFQVEEFVPERMRVEAAGQSGQALLGDPLPIDVSARYLFGGVPAKHKVEMTCELQPASFSPRENNSFHYGVWHPDGVPERPLVLGTVTGELDDEGAGTFSCPNDNRTSGLRGPAKLVARAAVFEAGSGRTTVGTTALPVHPESFYLGLSSGTTKVKAGNELVVDGVAVDWNGSKIDQLDTVEVQLIRLESEYGWYYDDELGRETYRRYLRPVVESKAEVTVQNGAFRHTFEPQRNGVAFLVRAQAKNARTDLELAGRGGWYYWGPRSTEVDQTPRPGRPTWIALDVPEKARVKERFPVRFKAPYRGRVLLTAETDHVLKSEWRDVDAGEAIWFVELEDFTPNVYVTAFLVKDPRLEGAFMPDRAFGVESVTVEPTELTHPLKLDVPSEVRSNARLAVKLDLGPQDKDRPAYATVAAVDQGILSLTGFKSPDPFETIFARRALGVETFETIGWTLAVPPGGSTATSGGDAAGSLDRVQPVKPVALWSGLVKVPADGELEVSFDLPQYRGELRVMAVTADAERMGHADAKVTVRDPLIVQATLPRFLVHEDQLEIPVFVTNLSGEKREVEVELLSENLAVEGLEDQLDDDPPAVRILGQTSASLVLDNGQGENVVFRAVVDRPVGAAKLTVTASAPGFESSEESTVPILPAGPKSRRVQRLPLAEGSHDLTTYLDGWLPLSERSTFWVTANPYGDAFDHLEYLVRYPYGCLEQTTSSTRPLLYLGQLLQGLDPGILEGRKIEDMVMAGVERLLSMQTPVGGFAYWMGGTEPAYWASAYATHLLLDAQALDYPVPAERLDDALDWMERQITNHYEAGRQNDNEYYSSNAEPYLHFVLAKAGRARKARIEKLIEQLGQPTRGEEKEHLFMLRAALHMAGDQRYERELKQADLSTLSDERRDGWSFYSDRRRRGFMLATLVDLFGRDAQFELLANLVADGLRGGRYGYYTTQELVWSITGLGKLVEVGAEDFEPPVLRAAGRRLAPQASPGAKGKRENDRTWHLLRASEYDELTLEVPGKDDGKLFLVLSSEGVRENPDWRTGGEGLSIDRRYRDAKGQIVDLTSRDLVLGDLVYVELLIRNPTGQRITNIALVDRVPAGFEIENPRLGRGGDQTQTWIDTDQLWQADHMDLRDDRLEVFGHLGARQERRVVYTVRAVTAGRFTIPPAEAEAMYEPRLWAREPARQITIHGPWTLKTVAAVRPPSTDATTPPSQPVTASR